MKVDILIVDDEKAIRESLARRYSFKGWSVDTAENGEDALNKMKETSYKIIISDIVMPVMNGVELLKVIRSDYPSTKAIMITGHVTLSHAVNCMRYGAFDMVFKPIDLTVLDDSVKEVLGFLDKWENRLSNLVGMKE